jgi:pyridoxine/pyridoxamine 5'-phosphate oxidase
MPNYLRINFRICEEEEVFMEQSPSLKGKTLPEQKKLSTFYGTQRLSSQVRVTGSYP